jgi:hypothetical protein
MSCFKPGTSYPGFTDDCTEFLSLRGIPAMTRPYGLGGFPLDFTDFFLTGLHRSRLEDRLGRTGLCAEDWTISRIRPTDLQDQDRDRDRDQDQDQDQD